MVVLITAAETERLLLEATRRELPAGFPRTIVARCGDLQQTDQISRFLDGPAKEAALFVVRVLGGKPYFDEGFARIARFCFENNRRLMALPGDRQPDAELAQLSNVPIADAAAALEYCIAGGVENYRNLLLFLSDLYCSTAFGAAEPRSLPDSGFYHPLAAHRLNCATMDAAAFQAAFWRGDAPGIGVLFYRAHWESGNLAVVDALIGELELMGANVLPVFCYSLRSGNSLSRFLGDAASPAVDCLISNLNYTSVNLQHGERVTTAVQGEANWLADFGLPILQVASTSQSVEEWRNSNSGLTPLDAANSVVMPEFDGRIITTVQWFRDQTTRPDEPQRSVADPAQVRRIARLAVRYSKLGRIANRDKRVVVMLTNFANKQGRVGGAVGLDTPASVIEILKAMARRGYDVGEIPQSGDELIRRLIERGGYDTEFLSEDQMAVSDSGYSAARYRSWFESFPQRNQAAVAEAWGPPPGTVYRTNDQVYVAGMQLGNVFVMIQPPRGFGENPLAVYHSGDLIPTHHYLGAYRWLRDEFRADAVVHCGKHGTLEWLPGKALGLSDGCYPELAIDDLPVFYPFIVNDPGEGSQAKRRMHACIVDHLIPPMMQAETSDRLADLQQLLTTHAEVERVDPAKLALVRDEIWNIVVESNLQNDLEIAAKPGDESFAEFLQHIDGYLCEIGDLQVRGGLHTLGQVPAGDSLLNLALSLVRHDSEDCEGIRKAIALDLGVSFESLNLRDRLGGVWRESPDAAERLVTTAQLPGMPRTNGEALKALEKIARQQVEALAEAEYDVRHVDSIAAGSHSAGTLRHLCTKIMPALKQTSREIENLLNGLEGRRIPAGPSGAPTRGMSNVLPTGKNFYSVDVRAIPSRFSWEIGRRLAEGLIDKFQKERGRYPECVGITVWGTANMRTRGDDVAEILWLWGVRPKWSSENQRVVGLDPIALEELGRPRIDVTVRMSGFFRDAFPGVVRLMDDAVRIIAELDEPLEMNFVRRRVQRDERSLIERGLSANEAAERARFRLFSNKPGGYGTGILESIMAGNWSSCGDLAEIYLNWGSYAYSRFHYGTEAPMEFRSLLASADVAIQNIDNREHDIFDSDDYLQFHGGMVAAIRALSGTKPSAYLGDSSVPEQAVVDDLQREVRRIFRARVTNPRWLNAIRRHGYKGGLEMAATVDYVFGYDATASVGEDWMYQDLAQKYVLDDDSRAFLDRSNPWALREMTGRLIEAASRGMWKEPDSTTLDQLKQVYLDTEGLLEGGPHS
jgi:cobaltochelatase CobN